MKTTVTLLMPVAVKEKLAELKRLTKLGYQTLIPKAIEMLYKYEFRKKGKRNEKIL